MTNPMIMPPTNDDYAAWHRGDPPTSRRDRGVLAAVAIAAIATIVVGALLLTGNVSQPAQASVSEILQRPAAFDGERVVSEGDIDEFLTDRSLVVEGAGDREDGLLVLIRPGAVVTGYPGAQPPALPVAELLERDSRVEFRGTVDVFEQSEMSDELGIVLHPRLFAGWEGRPSVIVDRIDLARPVERAA